jgi:hypothetical protein
MKAQQESPVLQAVANPPTLFFVPIGMGMLNIAIQVAIWALLFVTVGLSPIIVIATVILGHVFLISVYAREMHIETIIRAAAKYSAGTRNLVRTRGRAKYVP